MKTIKEITKGEYKLIHSEYIDEFGMERNDGVIEKTNEDGSRVIKPVVMPIRVRDVSQGAFVSGDDTSPYSNKEYTEILDSETPF